MHGQSTIVVFKGCQIYAKVTKKHLSRDVVSLRHSHAKAKLEWISIIQQESFPSTESYVKVTKILNTHDHNFSNKSTTKNAKATVRQELNDMN